MRFLKGLKKIFVTLLFIIAVLCFIIGPILGCHVTFYQMLYGGIVDIIAGASINPMNATLIAEGVLKVILCAVPGVITCALGFIVGLGVFALWGSIVDA